MARTPSAPDLSRQILRMQEQIRQLRLRKAGGVEPVEAWQSLASRLGAGWSTEGTLGVDHLHARFYKDRDRVYFAGSLSYIAAAGSDASKPVVSMPAGYIPAMMMNMTIVTDPDNTGTGGTFPDTRNQFWTVEVSPVGVAGAGQWLFDQNKNFLASPDFGSPPTGTVFYLEDLSYRIS